MQLNLDAIKDFADRATDEVAKYTFSVTLSPTRMEAAGECAYSLTWDSISYGRAEIEKVPNDKRGIYAFAICQQSSELPPHGYILYIGITGLNSQRHLRARYAEYLNERSVIKRARIARMIGTWHNVLRFFFAPVEDDVTSDELIALEKRLNDAVMPPFSEGDFTAEIRRMRRAFR